MTGDTVHQLIRLYKGLWFLMAEGTQGKYVTFPSVSDLLDWYMQARPGNVSGLRSLRRLGHYISPEEVVSGRRDPGGVFAKALPRACLPEAVVRSQKAFACLSCSELW